MKTKLYLFLSMVVFIPGVDADYVPVDRFGNEQYQQPIYKAMFALIVEKNQDLP
jgi:hypothetical protein